MRPPLTSIVNRPTSTRRLHMLIPTKRRKAARSGCSAPKMTAEERSLGAPLHRGFSLAHVHKSPA